MVKSKVLGQVFTPQKVVEQVLDELGYVVSGELFDKLILEPSFGEGVFLREIIKRLVLWGKLEGFTDSDVVAFVDDNVWGVELDPVLFNSTKQGLVEWVFSEFGLTVLLPNLFNMDALDFGEASRFDFVVGNPPYVRVHNLSEAMRSKVKRHVHSNGTTDLYVIFFELGLRWLNETGRLGFITPNSWLRNASQTKFRSHLVDNRLLFKVIDFGTKKVFGDASIYTNVTILDKTVGAVSFVYEYAGDGVPYVRSVRFDEVKVSGAGIIFPDVEGQTFLGERERKFSKTLGELCNVQNGVTTLGDKFFVVDGVTVADRGLEEAVLLPVVKGSKYRGEPVTSRIIFPYSVVDGRVTGLSEDSFKTTAPNVYAYLSKNRGVLGSRALDRNSLWFWFGRSQALQVTFKPKLVVSSIVSPSQDRLRAYVLPAGSLVYSGLIVTETGGLSLDEVKTVVESEDFCRFAKIMGKNMSGGYKNINSKILKAFLVA